MPKPRRVVLASACELCDCCDEPLCPYCDGEHFADCECPGIGSEDVYFEVIDGELWAYDIEQD